MRQSAGVGGAGRGDWQDRSSDSAIFSGASFMSPVLVSPLI